MRSSLSLLAALVVMSSVVLAQPGRRPATPRRTDAAVTADASAAPTPAATTDAGAPDSTDAGASASPTCCCRAWSHGWQYAWRAERECAAQSGTCVSPDHC